MTRFFKLNPPTKQLLECDISEGAEFIEIYRNWEAFAIPMVLGLKDAVSKYTNRFEANGDSYSVIAPSIWLALFEHNVKYCPPQEAELLSQATLAMRPC
ncbi:hypothetical protein [Legionella bononiensis]|uniref:Uncharacterized protein n=1 Tax=Legionella bononiensis TaxID=2793102 RepID=A0ABS1WB28_9GAMM|nr:hypothetical protein [Legionella bononiensis]MBL7480209.1 hypothetical protein [Legionella bononiensis]MBL7526559.1 hypothetical protein [Legionella bononiensis]MBL7562947.1 hypothetical protein [Legionella bononiensis]